MALFTLPPALREAMGQIVINDLESGGAGATLQFFTDAQPADPSVAVVGQVLLGTLVCANPPAYMSAGAIVFNAMAQDNAADATGVASWARLSRATGEGVADFDVTVTGQGGSITLNTTNIVEGGPILMSGLAIWIGS